MIGHKLVKLGKIEVELMKLDIFMIYWKVQFRKIILRVKSPNFGYRICRTCGIIRPVGVQFRQFYHSKNYSKIFGASQYLWFSIWSLNNIFIILQALMPSLKTTLQRGRTEYL